MTITWVCRSYYPVLSHFYINISLMRNKVQVLPPTSRAQVPRAWAEARMNVAQWNEFASGGHFAALEEPQALLQDIRSFVDKHVVSGAVLQSM